VDPSAPSAGPAPLRRLTRAELENTIADLLGDAAASDVELSGDEKIAGFSSNSIAPITLSGLEDYEALSAETAERALAEGLADRLGCDPLTTACIQDSTSDFGRRMFRRPLSTEEVARFVGLHQETLEQEDPAAAAKLWLQALLLSPHFLYHVERGAPTEDAGIERLDGYSVASRLSYLIWQSAPDPELLAAAESGQLAEAEGRRAAAERLLQDERARRGVAAFHREWLGIDGLVDATKDTDAFPIWNADLARQALRETEDFASFVVLEDDGRLGTLLSASYGFPQADLATLYGVTPAVSGPTTLGSERAGVLTQIAFLATHAHASEVSWVHRGKLIRERLLCETIPAPPPVDQKEANDPDRLTNPDCSGCHVAMDPIGKGFDAFDAVGRYDADTAAPGEIFGDTTDVSGPFESVSELASRLADSDDVRRCVARQWFRYAVRRKETEHEACAVSTLGERFNESGGDIRQLLVEIAEHEAFVTRRVDGAQ
jgi:hypothetical protein